MLGSPQRLILYAVLYVLFFFPSKKPSGVLPGNGWVSWSNWELIHPRGVLVETCSPCAETACPLPGADFIWASVTSPYKTASPESDCAQLCVLEEHTGFCLFLSPSPPQLVHHDLLVIPSDEDTIHPSLVRNLFMVDSFVVGPLIFFTHWKF